MDTILTKYRDDAARFCLDTLITHRLHHFQLGSSWELDHLSTMEEFSLVPTTGGIQATVHARCSAGTPYQLLAVT